MCGKFSVACTTITSNIGVTAVDVNIPDQRLVHRGMVLSCTGLIDSQISVRITLQGSSLDAVINKSATADLFIHQPYTCLHVL